MKLLCGLVFFLGNLSFALEKEIVVLTPVQNKKGNTVVSVSYLVQHPHLKGSRFLAYPFPGLRKLIIKKSVSKNLFISKENELFEILTFPTSPSESLRLLQKVILVSPTGVTGESLPLSEDTQKDLVVYFMSDYKEEKTAEAFSRTVFLLKKDAVSGINKEKACAFIRENRQIIVESRASTKDELDLLIQTKCLKGSG